MMWPKLYTTRTLVATRDLNVPPQQVLDFLHDPPAMIMRSPVVVSYEQLSPDDDDGDDSPPRTSKYTITDKVPVLFGLFHTKQSVQASFTPVTDGTCMFVEAVAGTTLMTTWHVQALPAEESGGEDDRPEGQTSSSLLTETIEITGLSFLMPFIMRTMRLSQQKSLETLVSQICKDQ